MNSYSQPDAAAPEHPSSRPLVLKLGGELLESVAQRANIAQLAAAAVAERPLVIIHGGGRAIDAELKRRQIAPRKVDGLRITDADTLEAVVAVLAGSANTDLVAACVGAGIPAVGLTGVDAGFGRARRTAAYLATDGQTVDLGHVGDPEKVEPRLVRWLVAGGFVPVIASLGLAEGPGASVLNVNADVMACRLAAALGDSDLVIAGGTPGVLDGQGQSIPALDVAGIDEVIASGTATAGMVAKLSACRAALVAGVASVRLVDGRGLDGTRPIDGAAGTTLTR
jgi:acetylglutamate kinase